MEKAVPTTDKEAEQNFHKQLPEYLVVDAIVTYKTFREDEPVPDSYIMTLESIIQQLDYEREWGDDD